MSFRCEALAKAQQLSMLLSLPWYVWVKHEIRVDLSEQRSEVYWAQWHQLHGTCWDLRRAVRWLGNHQFINRLLPRSPKGMVLTPQWMRPGVKGRKGQWIPKMDVSENCGTPKSSILIGFSIINHPFWGTPIFGNTQRFSKLIHFRFTNGARWATRPRSSVLLGTQMMRDPSLVTWYMWCMWSSFTREVDRFVA